MVMRQERNAEEEGLSLQAQAKPVFAVGRKEVKRSQSIENTWLFSPPRITLLANHDFNVAYRDVHLKGARFKHLGGSRKKGGDVSAALFLVRE
jgi:hypothetical protein